jgi:hypothetical protein
MKLAYAGTALAAALLPLTSLARLHADAGKRDEGEKKNMRELAAHKDAIYRVG